MAKNKKEEYKEKNIQFLTEIALQEGVVKLPGGVLYKVVEQGTGSVSPQLSSVVSVHYRGTLIDGREFDNSRQRNCPEAFRLNQVIEGWQQALQQMHVGDKWIIYIPYTLGYGNRPSGPIPAFSTLIFEVELLGIS
ncbi:MULTISPECIES: FKBP-type peptidyl-prolyl cis-trans isomerase [Parabacteroides]|uniref:FKBP-type peptidyl-prolyl cis-trans isomerase n=1 Tax=Parabacteroides leei TaxID=2939491 RepID=UPI001896D1A2|nr:MULTISPECIES: FKBP-type peptidyl-prolyl cis-trans isomerase [Parabacteroides]MCL3851770.1 FKBP-type peptidyl-prolyl cis-trans isomerase [Parabacteroides leei]